MIVEQQVVQHFLEGLSGKGTSMSCLAESEDNWEAAAAMVQTYVIWNLNKLPCRQLSSKLSVVVLLNCCIQLVVVQPLPCLADTKCAYCSNQLNPITLFHILKFNIHAHSHLTTSSQRRVPKR